MTRAKTCLKRDRLKYKYDKYKFFLESGVACKN